MFTILIAHHMCQHMLEKLERSAMRRLDAFSLLIIDPQVMFVEGLRALLNQTDRCEVIGMYTDNSAGLLAYKDLQPEIVLISDSVSGIHIINTIHEIRLYDTAAKIAVLGDCLNNFIVIEALKAGVMGYLSKHNAFSTLERALMMIHQGQPFFCERVSQILAKQLVQGSSETSMKAQFDRLTIREKEIMIALLNGRSISQVADSLNISRKTVTTHKSKIYQKLNVTNMVELVRLGAELGL